MQSRRWFGWSLAALLALALVLRVVAAVLWQSRLPEGEKFAFGDSESYWSLAECIAHGDAYQFAGSRAFRTPGYPALLAPLFWMNSQPPVMAARLLGVVLGVAVVGGVSCLAWMLFDKRAALIAAATAALYPGAIAMSILVLSEALFCPLMIAGIVLWAAAWRSSQRSRSLWLAVAVGALAGLATLARPSWLLFIPFAILVAIAFCPPRKRQVELGAALLLGLLVVMTPWWVRNWRVLSAFVPTTTQTGPSLYDGLHPGATGGSDMSFVPQVKEQFAREARARSANNTPTRSASETLTRSVSEEINEVALNRYFTNKAIRWARENPGQTFQLAGIKFVRMWNIWPNEQSLRSWPLRLAVAAGYIPILVLAVLGAIWFSRRGWPYVLCWLPAVYFTLLHMVFVGSIRYRQPAMLLLIVLAAGCVSAWMDRRMR